MIVALCSSSHTTGKQSVVVAAPVTASSLPYANTYVHQKATTCDTVMITRLANDISFR